MSTLSEGLLEFIYNYIRGLDIFDKLTNILVPRILAHARCWTDGWFCYHNECGNYCGSKIVGSIKYCYYWEKLWYDPISPDCDHMQTCIDPCEQGCWEDVCSTCACPL